MADTFARNMRAVDTNVLVRLLTRDDVGQSNRAEKFIAQGAWVSHLVLAEAMWVLSAAYGLSAEKIAKAVEMLLDHGSLSIQDPDTVRRALEHFHRKPGLGFSDCLVVEIARAAGHVPLATFDKDLSKVAGAQRI